MVASRGVTPVLALCTRSSAVVKATLCVLYVREVAVFSGPFGGSMNVQMGTIRTPHDHVVDVKSATIMLDVRRLRGQHRSPARPF